MESVESLLGGPVVIKLGVPPCSGFSFKFVSFVTSGQWFGHYFLLKDHNMHIM
jgi:hypothetical protein